MRLLRSLSGRLTVADLFDPPAKPQAPLSIQSAAAPFLRWADLMDAHYGNHKDDALLVGGFPGGITFGDLRRLRDAARAQEARDG